ncbi:MAG: hypothetical protein ACM3L8_01505 [Verrucomicrobiota bacterium]
MTGKRWAGAVLILALWSAIPARASMAESRHEGMQHGKAGGTMESMGEQVYQGASGPWKVEVRLIDMKAQLEKSGVSAKTIAQLSGTHHLMVMLTDPKTGKPVAAAMGEVIIKGPDRASSSKVTLVTMGEHIGSDIALPRPGKYAFRVTLVVGGQRAYAVFDYDLKK